MIHQWPILDERAVGSRQWIFDRVVEHHRKQRARCPSEGQCHYRFGELACFAEPIIGEHWNERMEGLTVREIARFFPVPDWFKANIGLIAALQALHDCESNWPASRMDRVLARFAKENGLRMP